MSSHSSFGDSGGDGIPQADIRAPQQHLCACVLFFFFLSPVYVLHVLVCLHAQVIRSYGAFLEDVKGNEAEAQRLYSKVRDSLLLSLFLFFMLLPSLFWKAAHLEDRGMEDEGPELPEANSCFPTMQGDRNTVTSGVTVTSPPSSCELPGHPDESSSQPAQAVASSG